MEVNVRALSKNSDPMGEQGVEEAARVRLAKTGYPVLKTVECSFRDGRIILHGQVPSYYHKQLAQAALRDAKHIDQVVNHLEVISP
jgi:hypothetical protein